MAAATVTKELPAAWFVGAQHATDIEVREPLLEDLIEAERDAHPHLRPTAFRMALACRLIVRAGQFTGPFTPGQFSKMKPRVWGAISNALDEAEALGEAVQPSPDKTS